MQLYCVKMRRSRDGTRGNTSSRATQLLLVTVFVVGMLIGRSVFRLGSTVAQSSEVWRPTALVIPADVPRPTLGTVTHHPPSTDQHPSVARGHVKHIASDVDDDEWPLDRDRNALHRFHTQGTRVRCVSRGMQRKCLFSNLVVKRNQFFVYDADLTDGHPTGTDRFPSLEPTSTASYPNPIYPPDGQTGPLVQNHKYHGHPIRRLPATANATGLCTRFVARPTLFLFRMSGHSTYHLWENNLGPFYATLLDNFDLSTVREQEQLRQLTLDPTQLLISFVDRKPRRGPKAPILLDQLLRLFTNTPLLNASRLSESTCFATAVVGTSSNRFPHRALVREVQRRLLSLNVSNRELPERPTMIYISRNHPKVTRGRKMMNEDDVFPELNRTMHRIVGSGVRKVFMEDLSFTEQIRLASETHIMFSPHGGGVANCIWMPPGAVVVEFVAPIGKTLPGMYHSMCGNSGVKHFHFLADPDPRDASIRENPRLFSNLIMPVDRMIDNAKKALVLYSASRLKTTR